jgi:hypothetical protein
VRDRIIRQGRTWLPAVLRGNTVPVKVLIEMANLNNPQDRSRLQDPPFRESFARAFVDSLLAYYRPSPKDVFPHHEAPLSPGRNTSQEPGSSATMNGGEAVRSIVASIGSGRSSTPPLEPRSPAACRC